MIYYILTAILTIIIMYFKHKIKNRYKSGDHIPGPSYIPLIGNIDVLFIKSEDIFSQFQLLREKYGKIYRLWLVNELWIIMSDPKDIEVILTNQRNEIRKSDDYFLMHPWLGTGLLTSFGAKWFTRRKVITPSFHFNILEQFIQIFDAQATILINKIECNDRETFDVTNFIALCTLDIICETSLGTSPNAQQNSDSAYCNAIKDLSRVIYHRMIHPLGHQNWYFAFKEQGRTQKKAIKIIHEFTDKIIKKRRYQLLKSNNNKNYDTEHHYFGIKRKMALLDVLLQARIDNVPLSDKDIREEVNTFGFAGHDTITSAISFLLYNIAKYEDVQQKVCDEIIAVFGSLRIGYGAITLYKLNELKYLDLVIKESLRMYPPVPYVGRQILKEMEINGKIIPKNSNITIGVYLMNHDPDIFYEPEKFIPERFNSKYHPFSYIPFSAGQRNCIGQRFAMLEMKTVIIKVLSTFIISLPENVERPILIPELVMKSKNGITITFKSRREEY